MVVKQNLFNASTGECNIKEVEVEEIINIEENIIESEISSEEAFRILIEGE